MKRLNKITMKPIAGISALASAMLLSISGQSVAAEIDKRWFEVEVILFSQLGDKNALQENFSGESDLPKYRTVIDLLTPYLQPDTRALQLQLPSCIKRQYRKPLIETQATIPPLHQEKSLADIEQLAFEQAPADGLTQDLDTTIAPLNDVTQQDAQLEVLAGQDSEFIQGELNQEELIQSELTQDELTQNNNEQALAPFNDGLLAEDSSAQLTGLSEHEIALIEQAEAIFKHDAVNFDYQQVSTFEETLCQSTVINEQSTLADYAKLNESNITGEFPIESLTGTVDGNEFVYSDEPYLIDADSLQLKDITLQLRRSKNFKPLLHLGWRQPLTNRKRPSREPAIRIFAGEHFQQSYQEQLAQYQAQETLHSLTQWQQAQMLDQNHTVDSQQDGDTPLTETSLAAARIEQIWAGLANESFDTSTIVATLDAQELALNKDAADESNTLMPAPIEPNQDWLLDGFFRLHLNHYLFITADFNYAVPNEAAAANQHNKENEPVFKLIPFKQNKRVISKEVHYFDHPYMGMVVQIRRYEKPEPEPKLEPEQTTTE